MSSVTTSDVAPFDNDVRGGEATPVVMSTEEELDRTSAEKTLESPAEGIKTKGEEFKQKELRQKELRQKELRQKEEDSDRTRKCFIINTYAAVNLYSTASIQTHQRHSQSNNDRTTWSPSV